MKLRHCKYVIHSNAISRVAYHGMFKFLSFYPERGTLILQRTLIDYLLFTVSSMRRFLARPSSESLDASGWS